MKTHIKVGSKTDPRGTLEMNQWERNENYVRYKWNWREGGKSPAVIQNDQG